MICRFFNKSLSLRRNFVKEMSKKAKSKNTQKETEVITKQEEGPITSDKSKNILISILAKPGAKQNAITSINSDGVGVQINAPPSEGEANTELVKYIASVLGLRKSDVTLNKGFKSRNKVLKIEGSITLEEVKSKLLNEIQNA
ncbi:UPF0235 protein C15orf40 homolog [Tribolium madens]|uniref:UPF0235 protein C15orf40 homolog n=1 Tax=Tribolium madens TaxID=41895 RepID=UPI001CF74E00|nr:UPF0235 protein C15orf40 homolog [Tribolium madens]